MGGKFGSAILLSALISGCASVSGSNVQTLRIETKMPDGTAVDGADCELINEKGRVRVTSPGFVNVHRSASDLKVNCIKGGYPAANANGVSRANLGMFGNVIIGGVPGATVDHFRGAGYSYPEWMPLVFGRYLRFDRYDDQSDQPSLGVEQVRY